MAVLLLPPLLAKLRAQQPGIELEIIATSTTRDLRRREADIAIRNVQPTHSELIARKLSQCNAYLYATPEDLQKIGSPSNIDKLAHADYVGYDGNSAYVLEQIGIKLGAENFPYKTGSYLTHWPIVKEGAAIGVMPGFVGDKEPLVRRVSDKLPFVNLCAGSISIQSTSNGSTGLNWRIGQDRNRPVYFFIGR